MNINGAGAIAAIEPNLHKYVEKQVGRQINEAFKKQLPPEAGSNFIG